MPMHNTEVLNRYSNLLYALRDFDVYYVHGWTLPQVREQAKVQLEILRDNAARLRELLEEMGAEG